MFMMLTGIPPYDGSNDLEIVRSIRSRRYNGCILDELTISEDAMDLISKLLAINPEKRLSAEDALGHQWIKRYDTSHEDPNITRQCLIQLSNFNTYSRL